MRNKFEIHGEDAVIHLLHKGETKTVMVSRSDLPKIMSIPGTWWAMDVGGKRGEKIYAGTQIGGVTIYMHHIVIRPIPSRVIDHRNHDTLDNRRSNLRMVTYAENNQNRKGAQRNNRHSGFRNVYKAGNRWSVRLTKNGREIRVGTFDSVDIANQVAKVSRDFYYEQGNDGELSFDQSGVLIRE